RGVDHRADIYALGVVVHEMLTGRRLFDADSAVELFMLHVTAPPPPMSSVCPEVPSQLDAPVLAMLEKNPADRPGSAGEAIAALVARARGVPERPAADATLEISASVATPNALVIPIEA